MKDYRERITAENKHLQEKCKDAESRVEKLQNTFSKIFYPDQIEFLLNGRVKKWSKETTKKGIQVRFIVGITGYLFLIENEKLPYPLYASLCRRIQKVPITYGISVKTIELMNQKVICFNEPSRLCILSLDEMEVTEKQEYDKGNTNAKKLLLLVARGVTTKWKQIIGWHLTDGHSATGAQQSDFINQGIIMIESAGYRVKGIVFDMGPSNQAIWAHNRVNRQTHVTSHPIAEDRLLYWFANAPHLYKNLRSGFLKHNLTLSQDIVQKENLSTDALENIFSVVRSRGSLIPSALQAIRAVRMITIAQFIRDVKKGNYSKDDDLLYLDFLQSPQKSQNIHIKELKDSEIELVPFPLNTIEKEALDHFTGAVNFNCLHYACETCKEFIVNQERVGSIKTMEGDHSGYTYPSEGVVLAGHKIELICKNYMDKMLRKNNIIEKLTAKAINAVQGVFFLQCSCRYLREFCTLFIRSRLYFNIKIKNAEISRSKKRSAGMVFASKTVTSVKKKKIM